MTATKPLLAIIVRVYNGVGTIAAVLEPLRTISLPVPREIIARVLAFLDKQGRLPCLLFETSEEAPFKARFQGHSRFGALDWPPITQIGREVRIFNPADRARYLAGDRIKSERVWPERPSAG